MIKLNNVSKSYDGKSYVIDELDIQIDNGELVVLVGESGCGKTTTMKMINRLIEPTGGEILIDDRDIKTFDKNDLRRNIGYVIQDVGLFPHLTIEKNIATVPLLCKKDKAEVMKRVEELLDLIELPHKEQESQQQALDQKNILEQKFPELKMIQTSLPELLTLHSF